MTERTSRASVARTKHHSTQLMRLLLMCTVFAALLTVAARECVAEPWPAEPWLGAANLTALGGRERTTSIRTSAAG